MLYFEFMSNRLHNSEKSQLSSSFTLQDIADELGIAKSSVSRALSGSGRISEETKRRVLECAERHQYKPNFIAKSLATSRSFNLGVLIPGDSDYSDIPFFHQCLSGITTEADKSGFDVLVLISKGNSTEHLERVLSQKKTDGIIITRLMEDDSRIELLKKAGMPFTVIGSTDSEDVVQVDTDNEDACRCFTSRLIESGMNRFLLVCGPSDIVVNRARRSGFMKALEAAGIPESCCRISMDNVSLFDVGKTLEKNRDFHPDCVIAADDVLCSYIMTWFERRKCRVPEDVRVASFYNSSLLEKYGRISAIDVNAPLVGKSAASLLLKMLDNQEIPVRNTVEYGMLFKDSTAVR